MEPIFTYNQVVHLNSELREKELPYRINFKDETVIGIEELGICACIGKDGLMRDAVQDFLTEKGFPFDFRRMEWSCISANGGGSAKKPNRPFRLSCLLDTAIGLWR